MASKMGRPADENLPEVVQYQTAPQGEPVLPEVVPDSSPEAAQQRYFMETDKYPAYYDTAPKLPHDEGFLAPGQQYSQQPQGWTGTEHSVSAISPNSSVPWQSFPPGADDQQTYVGSEQAPEKRICGIRKRLFIIIAVILGLVVVGAAVGGGVGGSMAARSSGEAAAAETASASSSVITTTTTTPTTTTATQSSTTSSAPTPSITFLNNQTDPAIFQRFAFQGFSGHNYTGKMTSILWEEGFYDFGFNVTSYIWIANKTSCCITFCANKTTDIGYRCEDRRRPAADDGFARLSVWCGSGTNTKGPKQCS